MPWCDPSVALAHINWPPDLPSKWLTSGHCLWGLQKDTQAGVMTVGEIAQVADRRAIQKERAQLDAEREMLQVQQEDCASQIQKVSRACPWKFVRHACYDDPFNGYQPHLCSCPYRLSAQNWPVLLKVEVLMQSNAQAEALETRQADLAAREEATRQTLRSFEEQQRRHAFLQSALAPSKAALIAWR